MMLDEVIADRESKMLKRIIARLLQMLDTQCVKLDMNLTDASLPARITETTDNLYDVRLP